MSIRKAEISDAAEIRTLVLSLAHFYLEDKDSPLPTWLAATLDQGAFEQRLASSGFDHFVYLNNGRIGGYIALKDKHHLYHLFVAEDQQGKGIARKLWGHLLTACPSDRYSVRSSLHAVAVYKRFGFIESGDMASKDGVGFQPMEVVY